MNYKILILSILFASCASNKYINSFSCEKIEKGIMDEKLYDNLNGKIVMKPNRKVKLHRVVTPNDFYYVSDSLMKKIKWSIRKNNCNNIVIKKLHTPDEIPAKRHRSGEY